MRRLFLYLSALCLLSTGLGCAHNTCVMGKCDCDGEWYLYAHQHGYTPPTHGPGAVDGHVAVPGGPVGAGEAAPAAAPVPAPVAAPVEAPVGGGSEPPKGL